MYTMIDGWQPKDESVHLRFGIEYHQSLHDYETSRATGDDHENALHDCVRSLLNRCADYPSIDPDAKPSIRNKSKSALVRTVVWYLEKFQDDVAETVILDDGRPAMEVSFKFELDWGPKEGAYTLQNYLLCGHLDRVVRFNDELFVMDRKTTTGSLTAYYFNQYEPNNQMTLYSIAGQIVLNSPVRGVIIDAAQVLADSSAYQRGFTFRTQDQLDEWLNDIRILLSEAEHYATANHWPMNDTSCQKFGGCRFRDVCSKSPGVRNAMLKADFIQLPEAERWNPLASR